MSKRTQQFRAEEFKGQLSLGSDEATEWELGRGSVSLQEDTEKPEFPRELEKGTTRPARRFASRHKRNETHQRPKKVVSHTSRLVTTRVPSGGADPWPRRIPHRICWKGRP